MTDEFKAFRILLVPVALIIVFIVMPAMCGRKSSRREETATAPSGPAPATTGGGLQISGAPRTTQPDASAYPPGLSAERIQYLVEIDPQFAEPVIASIPKQYNDSDRVIQLLARKHYVEKAADGATVITHDGSFALTLSEGSDNWTFPIAKRAFDKVTHLSRVEDDVYDATFSWHYDAVALADEFQINTKKPHTATARFGGGERHWALTNWIAAPSDQR